MSAKHWLDPSLEIHTADDTVLPMRGGLKVTGAGVSSVEDDPDNDRTVVTFEGGGGGSAAVADDIGKSGPTNIDRVLGMKGVQFETGDTLGPGQAWVKRQGTKLRAAKPVPPNWFNVVDYASAVLADPESIRDGSTNATTAINAAIAAANAAGGGTVYAPVGRYKITAQLTTLGECVHLLGATLEGSSLGNGTTFETYMTDTALYMGEFNDFNWSTHSSVERITFICKANTESTWKRTIIDATFATPIVVETSTAHGLTTGDRTRVYGVLGNDGANCLANVPRAVTVIDPTHYSIDGSIGTGAFVTNLSNTSPIVATTSSAHGLSNGDVVDFRDVKGNLSATGFWHVNVLTATTYELVGSTGYAPYVNNASSFTQDRFDTEAGAAIENRGGTHWEIRDCAFIEYPLGLVLDGAESGIVDRCLFAGAGGGPGYAGLGDTARGIWLADGASRGRGFTLGGTTNDHRILSCVFGSYADNIYVQGGVGIRIRDCNFEGGRSAVNIGGPDILSITGCTMENYTQYLHFTGVAQTVYVTENYMGGNNTSLKVVGGVSFLTLLNNNLGSIPPIAGGTAYCIVGAGFITRCVALNNWNSRPSTKLADNEPGGYALGMNFDYNVGDVGLGVNKLNVADAMIDGIIRDNTKPLMRVAGTYTRYQHDSKSEQHHKVKFGSNSAYTGTTRGGTTGASESARILAAGSDADLTAFPVPDQTLALVAFTVIQWYEGDPTRRGIWRCSQEVHQYGAGIVLVGSLNDDVTPIADAGFTHPDLVDDGAGNLVVRVHAHASADTHVQVLFSGLAAGR